MDRKRYMDFIVNKIREVKRDTISMDSRFQELGLDSIEFVELIVEIEEEFGFEFTEEELNLERYYNIKDLLNVVDGHINNKISG